MTLSAKPVNIHYFLAATARWGNIFERAIPFILALILSLIVFMAVTSGFNKHPDEKHHYDAAKYYFNHWLPPQVGAPETADSYSKYGFSYLNELDLVYLLGAKFSQLLSPIIAKKFLALRFFNVFLFFLLVLYCTVNPASRLIFLGILITPQVWYIFSYFNNDAISLFTSLIIISEIVAQNSFFQRSLRATKRPQFYCGIILMGLLLGLMFLCKRNYYIYILFIFFIMSWQFWQNRGPSQEQLMRQYMAVAGIGLAVFLLRYGYDVSINGWHKTGQMIAYAEKVAEPQFKPSVTDSSGSFYWVHLRAKGLKYSELFSKLEWHRITFRSFFGVYDYMQIFSSSKYYRLVYYVIIAFLLFIAASVLINGQWGDRIFMIIVAAFMAATIFLSTWHSWINDFQAQGRYLFPMVGMLGALLYQSQKLQNKGLLALLVMILCGLAAYSFIFTGLSRLMTASAL
ncbi:MAG: hypothetical protein PHU44_14785 [Syntrophales bacterium]|nr:hypothetical protein [Syntrophales bacterium]